MMMIKMLMYYFASQPQLLVALLFRANIFRAQFESYINELKINFSFNNILHLFQWNQKFRYIVPMISYVALGNSKGKIQS